MEIYQNVLIVVVEIAFVFLLLGVLLECSAHVSRDFFISRVAMIVIILSVVVLIISVIGIVVIDVYKLT
jgi:hypothetical protein